MRTRDPPRGGQRQPVAAAFPADAQPDASLLPFRAVGLVVFSPAAAEPRKLFAFPGDEEVREFVAERPVGLAGVGLDAGVQLDAPASWEGAPGGAPQARVPAHRQAGAQGRSAAGAEQIGGELPEFRGTECFGQRRGRGGSRFISHGWCSHYGGKHPAKPGKTTLAAPAKQFPRDRKRVCGKLGGVRRNIPARPVTARRLCLLLALLAGTGVTWAAAAPADPPITGRFTLVPAAPPESGLAGGGIVDIDPRGSTYVVAVRPELGKGLRGLGLSEGLDLVGFSLNTGGIAHGLAVYRRAEGGQRWQGRWISSIDGGSSVGTMDFDADPKQPTLAGRHHFSGRRASYGQFDGTVAMSPQGGDFVLTYTTPGGAVLYRGVGAVRGERLVVAWSFGSSPALAVYQLGGQGELDGRRVSLRTGGRLEAMTEHLVPAGAVPSATPATEAAGKSEGAQAGATGSDVASYDMSASEPGAPVVKTSVYMDLMIRYGSEGWAERWLDRQLTVDESHLLQFAVHRHRAGDPTTDIGSRTVAQLIEEQRKLSSR